MRTVLVANMAGPVVEGFDVERLEDVFALISACYEHAAGAVILEGSALPPAFFDLRSRFAGEFVQKLVNHRLRVAAVFPGELSYTNRFREYIREASGGPHFRSFTSRALALEWLVAAT